MKVKAIRELAWLPGNGINAALLPEDSFHRCLSAPRALCLLASISHWASVPVSTPAFYHISFSTSRKCACQECRFWFSKLACLFHCFRFTEEKIAVPSMNFLSFCTVWLSFSIASISLCLEISSWWLPWCFTPCALSALSLWNVHTTF